MTKQKYFDRSNRRSRSVIAKANLSALEFLFWDHLMVHHDKQCAELVPYILEEAARAEYAAVQSLESWENVLGVSESIATTKAARALALLKDLPKPHEQNYGYWETKAVLWSSVIRGWLKTNDDAKAEEFASALLDLGRKGYDQTNSVKFEEVFRKELDSIDKKYHRHCAVKIRDGIAKACAAPNKYGNLRDETLRILSHAYVRFAEPSMLFARFKVD